MDGYKEAEKIEKTIFKLTDKYPINRENLRQWMLFARTIESHVSLLLGHCCSKSLEELERNKKS